MMIDGCSIPILLCERLTSTIHPGKVLGNLGRRLDCVNLYRYWDVPTPPTFQWLNEGSKREPPKSYKWCRSSWWLESWERDEIIFHLSLYFPEIFGVPFPWLNHHLGVQIGPVRSRCNLTRMYIQGFILKPAINPHGRRVGSLRVQIAIPMIYPLKV